MAEDLAAEEEEGGVPTLEQECRRLALNLRECCHRLAEIETCCGSFSEN